MTCEFEFSHVGLHTISLAIINWSKCIDVRVDIGYSSLLSISRTAFPSRNGVYVINSVNLIPCHLGFLMHSELDESISWLKKKS